LVFDIPVIRISLSFSRALKGVLFVGKTSKPLLLKSPNTVFSRSDLAASTGLS